MRTAAGDMAAGTADQPYLLRGHVAGEPVFIVIYEGNGAPREVYRDGIEPLFATAGQQICDIAVPFASCRQPGRRRSDLPEQADRPASGPE